MVKKSHLPTIMFRSLLVIVTALLLCDPISAHAGADAPPPPEDPQPAPEAIPTPIEPEKMEVYGTPVAIQSDAFYAVSFFHQPHISQSAFTMRLSKLGTVAGCAHLQRSMGPVGEISDNDDKTTIKYISNRMEVMLDVPVIANSDGEPRYTDYDCETSHLESYVDIALDRDNLLKRNVTQFAFKLPTFDLGKYDIDLSNDRLVFKSKYAEEVPETWLTLWFFPKATVKLYVPEAKSDMNVIDEIRDFGIAHGLVPMDNILRGFTLPHYANDYVYFLDPKRVFLRDLSVQNNNKQVGDIGVTKTYYGANGSQDRIKPLPIYASQVLEQKIWK